MAQIILEDLSYAERIKYLENSKNAVIIRETKIPVRYEIKQSNKMVVNGQELLNAATEQEWLLKEVVRKDNGFVFDIVCTKNEITKYSPAYNEIMNFSQKIHTTYEHLLLKTDRHGYLVEVVNKKEIADKWEQLKTYELALFFAGTEKETVESALDKEFQDPLPGLMSDWLYILFFIPNHSLRWKQEIRGKAYKFNLIKTKSIFLQEIGVQLQNNETVKEITDDKILLQQDSSLIEEQKLFGDTEVEKSYKKRYRELFGKDFEHQFQHHADYTLDRKTGLVKNCRAIVSERLQDQLYTEKLYEITQKTTEI
ncbi:MAG: hypothetical protein LBT25_02760 [Candidatus Symbiothrix sp.]|jgi:hypothetical protein|nr:hypothetical protein [Candidatus Symbiothrix sp.]